MFFKGGTRIILMLYFSLLGHSHHNLQTKLGFRHTINQYNVSWTYVELFSIQNTHRKQTIWYIEKSVTCVVIEISVTVILQLSNVFLPRHVSVPIMVHYLVQHLSVILNFVPRQYFSLPAEHNIPVFSNILLHSSLLNTT